MIINQEHVKFAKLLNQILIAEKRYTVESIARRTSTPEPTIREYCEGTIAVPVEFQALIYNATGDIDFLNFTISDTDKQLIDRRINGGKGEKSILRETSDVADAVGHLSESVEKEERIISYVRN